MGWALPITTVNPSEPGISIHRQVATKSMPLPSAISELKAIILTEISHVHGFMQLLMKPRNGMPWSQEDRSAILHHLKHLARSLPILVIFTFPGGSLLLPLLAWFLDRRKNRKKVSIVPSSNKEPAETTILTDSATQHASETVKR